MDYLRQGILYLRDQGSSIIFSSHNMANVEKICDDLVMIVDGQQVLYGSVEYVRQSFGRTHLRLDVPDCTVEELEVLPGVKNVRLGKHEGFHLLLEDEFYGKLIFQQVTQGNYIPTFDQHTPSLDDIFKIKVGESHE